MPCPSRIGAVRPDPTAVGAPPPPRSPRALVRLHHADWGSARLREICRAAEELGFDGLSLYDVASRPALECWTALAYCLGATTRLHAVPLVLSNPVRHPALVAKMAWDLNALTGGRIVLGLGAGGDEEDLRAYGLDDAGSMARRLDRLEEALELTRRLFSGEEVQHQGSHYRVRGLRLRGEGPPPPVLIGGHGSRLLRIAARYADAVNVGFGLSLEEWRRLGAWLDRLRRRSGLAHAPLILSHNAGASEATEERLVALWEEGVSWFFVLFEDLPRLAGMQLFARRTLPGLRRRLLG
jgi:alkanesulfonate monooxygenase SsuD/methylene tetrahydromethanopterin reductase-like flavin-dependent oxidoreductase (luciferase family)